MSSYSSNQENDAVSCPQCGGSGVIHEKGVSGVEMQADCGLCRATGTVTRKQERAYYDKKTPASKPPLSEDEIIGLEKKARNNRIDLSGGVTCPACRGKGISQHPKSGKMASCTLCDHTGVVSSGTAKLWKTR